MVALGSVLQNPMENEARPMTDRDESESAEQVFEELLGEWQSSEAQVIGEFSTDMTTAHRTLERDIADYRRRFAEALERR
jgi:hypothetical protein